MQSNEEQRPPQQGAIDAGSPEPQAAEALNDRYGSAKSPGVGRYKAGGISRPISYPPDLTPPESQASAEERRLLDRLKNSTSSLTIRVNKVKLRLEVVDVDHTECSICCVVRQNGFWCEIPRSEDVEIELEGRVYRTAFLGAWHTIPWLGVHIVVFPILPEE